MAIQKQNVEIIGGSQPSMIFNLSKDGVDVSRAKAYKVTFWLARHENSAAVYSGTATYDYSIRRHRLVLPSTVTEKLVGNYIYHIEVNPPNNETMKIISWYGNFNVIQGVE